MSTRYMNKEYRCCDYCPVKEDVKELSKGWTRIHVLLDPVNDNYVVFDMCPKCSTEKGVMICK